MLTSAQNFAAVQTELDGVFYQEFGYNAGTPSIATANTAEIFKPIQTEHAAYIQEIFKGSQLFDAIGEIGNVPESTPGIANKQTIYIKDFAKGINFLYQAIARLLSKFHKLGGTPMFRTIPNQAL